MAKTILVVDDDADDRQTLLDILKPKGYKLLTAADGESAIELATKEQPTLIFLDVILPGKNGFKVCRQLKKAPETEGIKIVLVTSKSQESDRFWGLKQGADDYVTKPIDASEVVAAAAKYL